MYDQNIRYLLAPHHGLAARGALGLRSNGNRTPAACYIDSPCVFSTDNRAVSHTVRGFRRQLHMFGVAAQFKKEHIEGAINIPLFRPVAGNGFWDNLKKGVMKFGLAMVATGDP